MLLGFVYMRQLEKRRPGALQRAATMLVGSRDTTKKERPDG